MFSEIIVTDRDFQLIKEVKKTSLILKDNPGYGVGSTMVIYSDFVDNRRIPESLNSTITHVEYPSGSNGLKNGWVCLSISCYVPVAPVR